MPNWRVKYISDNDDNSTVKRVSLVSDCDVDTTIVSLLREAFIEE